MVKKHLPGVELKAFGSRVTGRAKTYSDLDLVVMGDDVIPIQQMNALKFSFSDSDLPIMIDVVDWHAITPEFQQAIAADCLTLIDADGCASEK